MSDLRFMDRRSYDFYFAGELFDAKHLIGNAYLASEILTASSGKYRPVLPQDLEQRSLHPQDIRDEDIIALLEADLALFHFDGSELDSGTVVEFMIAKFADIPSVVLRSDFRASGDQVDHPWNLMASFYPRTEIVLIDALRSYKFGDASSATGSQKLITDPALSIERVKRLNSMIAKKVMHAFERVVQTPSLLEGQQQESVYHWLRSMFGFRRSSREIERIFERILKRKQKLQLERQEA